MADNASFAVDGLIEGDAMAALVFSDMENSTGLFDRAGVQRANAAWAAHDRRARDLLHEYGGCEIGRSDGLFSLFLDAGAAARFALDYQAASAAVGLVPRVGVHWGAVSLRRNADDDVSRGAPRWEVDGPATPTTARLMALARGGQVLVSGDMANVLAGGLPSGASLRKHGHYRFKGIETPVAVHELGVEGRSAFAPPPDGEKGYRVVADGGLWRPARDLVHNLPQERDAFVGRTRELDWLARRFGDSVRLITVHGTGGSGKTRLCRRYVWTWLGEWPGGIFFCDLSDARSPEAVQLSVASALSLPVARGDASVQLGRALAGRGRCLVILDNFEQVVESSAAIVGTWLDMTREAAFLVTSRERLAIPGETVLPLQPLSLADEAVELFVRRGRAQQPSFERNADNAPAIDEIVRTLDGLPLAIELAAARLGVLATDELLARLRERFGVLTGLRGVARHSTLRTAIDWSWDLLSAPERAAFAQASVFEGGFALGAAEAVFDLSRWPDAPPALDVIQALVDKSLLQPEGSQRDAEGHASHARFRMLASIREYAAGKLAEQEAARDAALRRHGRFYAAFGSEAAIMALYEHGGIARFHVLAENRDNVQAACERAIDRDDADCALGAYAALWPLIEMQGPPSTAVAFGERILAMPGLAAGERVRALRIRGMALRRAGRPQEAIAVLDEGLVAARALERPAQEVRMLLARASVRFDVADKAGATADVEAAQGMAGATDDRNAQATARNLLGIIHAEQGDYDAAFDHFTEALRLNRLLGDRRAEAAALANLAELGRERGDPDAIERFEAALEAARDIDDRRFAALANGNLASLYVDVGRFEDARIACERAMTLQREVGSRSGEGIAMGTLGRILAHDGCYAEARSRFAAGEALLHAVSDHDNRAVLLCRWAAVEIAAGDRDAARELLDRAEAIFEQIGDRGSPTLGQIARLRERLRAEAP